MGRNRISNFSLITIDRALRKSIYYNDIIDY